MTNRKENQLLNEIRGGADHTLFAFPEESPIDLLSKNDHFNALTQKMGQEIVKEFARERYIFGLLEQIVRNDADPVVSIKNFVIQCINSQKTSIMNCFRRRLKQDKKYMKMKH